MNSDRNDMFNGSTSEPVYLLDGYNAQISVYENYLAIRKKSFFGSLRSDDKETIWLPFKQISQINIREGSLLYNGCLTISITQKLSVDQNTEGTESTDIVNYFMPSHNDLAMKIKTMIEDRIGKRYEEPNLIQEN